jgi:hypothetical protein
MKRKLLPSEISTKDYLEEYSQQYDRETCIKEFTGLLIEGTAATADSGSPLFTVRSRLTDADLMRITKDVILDKLVELLKEQNEIPEETFNLQYSCAQILVWGHIYKPSTVDIESPLLTRNYLNDFTMEQWKAFGAMISHGQVIKVNLDANELHEFTHWTRLSTALTSSCLTSLGLPGCRLFALTIDDWKAFVGAVAALPIKELDLSFNALSFLTETHWSALLNPDLQHSRITHINLRNNPLYIGFQWQGLINFLAQFQRLSTLNMRWNEIFKLPQETWTLFCNFIKNSCVTTVLVEALSPASSPARILENQRHAELQTILNQNILKYCLFPGEASLKKTILFSMWHNPLVQKKLADGVTVPAELVEEAGKLHNQWGVKLGV